MPIPNTVKEPTGPDTTSRITVYLLRTAIIAALGGLLFGFETAVISGTTEWLRSQFELSGFALGLTVSSSLIGTIIGAILIGKPADAFGRRGILFVLAILFLGSAIGCAFAWGWWSFIFFRFIGGLAVGGDLRRLADVYR